MDAVWKRRGERWTRGRRVSKRSLDGEDGKGATTGRCAAKAVRREVVSAEMKMYVRVWLARLNLSLETAIDRGIGIGRIGVEKTTFAISLGKRIANTMIFSNVFDRFNRRRKVTFDFVKNIGRSSKTLFGLHKLRCVVGSFSSTAIVFEHRDRSSHQHRSIRRRKIDVRFL